MTLVSLTSFLIGSTMLREVKTVNMIANNTPAKPTIKILSCTLFLAAAISSCGIAIDIIPTVSDLLLRIGLYATL
ncbi:hypothetical protein SDC9_200308 [bioreactor metagenome]|uniref:Uncharacterized protein n=1 Tax=bioreactor metagenome TaxID=1076179 RepID=A0A645INK6_9ZZZZ